MLHRQCLNNADVTVYSITKMSLGSSDPAPNGVMTPGASAGAAWHDPRTNVVMSTLRLVLAAAMVTWSGAVAAQSWADAYKAGDYKAAADLLHPLVIQLAVQPGAPQDPAAPRQLAMMYADGVGVAKDPIAACEVAQVAQQAMMSPSAIFGLDAPAYDRRVEEANAFVSRYCDGLSEWDRIAASNWCFAFGMPETMFILGADSVRVGRGGVHLADAMPERPDQLVGCPMLIARVRPLTLSPPSDAAPGIVARHFVDLLFWRPMFKPGDSPRFMLQWEVFEVQQRKIKMVTMEEQLDTVDGWPVPSLPKDFDEKLSLQMIRSGNIEWKLAGAPPKRGWILMPEGPPR